MHKSKSGPVIPASKMQFAEKRGETRMSSFTYSICYMLDQLEEFILEASVNMGKIQPSTLQNTIYDLCDNIVLLTYSKLILLKVFDTIHNTVHLCEHNVLAVNVLHQSHGCNHYQIGM